MHMKHFVVSSCEELFMFHIVLKFHGNAILQTNDELSKLAMIRRLSILNLGAGGITSIPLYEDLIMDTSQMIVSNPWFSIDHLS